LQKKNTNSPLLFKVKGTGKKKKRDGRC